MKESLWELSTGGAIPFDDKAIDGSSELNDIKLWSNNDSK